MSVGINAFSPPPAPEAAAQPAARAPEAKKPAPRQPALQHDADWKNGAAAASLVVAIDTLRRAEEGIQQNYNEPTGARQYAPDLTTSGEFIDETNVLLREDGIPGNDQFSSLLGRASGMVTGAVRSLEAKDLIGNWPSYKTTIMRNVQQTRLIAESVRKQIDPQR